MSNLVPVWESMPTFDGPRDAPVEHAVAATVVEQAVHQHDAPRTRLVSPPNEFEVPTPHPVAVATVEASAAEGERAGERPAATTRPAWSAADVFAAASSQPARHVTGGGAAAQEPARMYAYDLLSEPDVPAHAPAAMVKAADVIASATGSAATVAMPGASRAVAVVRASHDDLDAELDLSALRTRDLAREALRARIISIAEQRQHRSAYEIVFILLAAAVAVLLAAPPLVQILLAAHGVQA